MITLTLKITGMDELERKLGTSLTPFLKRATFAVGEQVRDQLAVYPGPAHSPAIWVSEKQRRYYFAMRRALGLPLQYTRQYDPQSQRLGRSWNVRGYGETGTIVEPAATYAAWVQGATAQQPQHAATGWTTDEEAANRVQRSGAIEDIMVTTLEAAYK